MIAAVDCDLRKHYAVRSDGAVLHKASPQLDASRFDGCHLVLFEVASAKDYHQAGGPAAAYNARRWTIWNIAAAQLLDSQLADRRINMMVAPSSVWTKGYSLEQRHALAGCVQKQKDLNECEAMIFFYRNEPSRWTSLRAFLESV